MIWLWSNVAGHCATPPRNYSIRSSCRCYTFRACARPHTLRNCIRNADPVLSVVAVARAERAKYQAPLHQYVVVCLAVDARWTITAANVTTPRNIQRHVLERAVCRGEPSTRTTAHMSPVAKFTRHNADSCFASMRAYYAASKHYKLQPHTYCKSDATRYDVTLRSACRTPGVE